MTKVIKALFSGKVFLFVLALALLFTGWKAVDWLFKPQGAAAIREQLTQKQAAKETLLKQKAALEQEINTLSKELDAADPAAETGLENRPDVAVRVLRPEPIRDVLTLPAEAEAYEDVLAAAKNDGPVEWLGVDDGDSVKKGQPLAKIDADIFRQQYQSALAAEKLAQVQFDRIATLREKKVASQGEYDQAEAELEQKRAARAIAKENLDDATLYSPLHGLANEVFPELGEYVNRGEPIARLVDISTVKMVVAVPEKDVGYLHLGQPAQVHNPPPATGVTSGSIAYISYVADPQAKTFRVEIAVDNEEELFRPGMLTKAELLRRESPEALVIHAFTAMQTEEGPIVYVEQDGIARARSVKVGIRRGMNFEVTQGLKPGERLVVKGQRNLNDGAPVNVVEVLP